MQCTTRILLYSERWQVYLEQFRIQIQKYLVKEIVRNESELQFIIRCPTGQEIDFEIVARSSNDKLNIPLDFHILWCWTFPNELIIKAVDLVWIQTVSAGVDQFLYKQSLRDSITISQASGFHGVPMAEYVFGAILSHARGLFSNIVANRSSSLERMMPEMIEGKTIGFIGAGSIAGEIARKAKCFGMMTKTLRKRNVQGKHFDSIYTSDQIGLFCRTLDYLIIVTPLTGETEGLVNSDFINRLPRGIVLINIGRGEIVVEQDLIEALESGHISFAVLDVWNGDRPSESFFKMKNVLVTPHFSAISRQYAFHATRIFVENLICFFTGKPLGFVIDRQRGY